MFTFPVGVFSGLVELWTPAAMTTALWLDASDFATLFDATTGGSAVTADGAIARWEDKSGNSRHLSQSTSGDRPLRKTVQVNGLDVVRFDGSSDRMVLDADLPLTSHTIFAVFNPSATIQAVSGYWCLLSGGTGGVGTSEMIVGFRDLSGVFTSERISYAILQNDGIGINVFGYAKTNADVSGVNQFGVQWDNDTQAFAGQLNGNTDFATTGSAGGFTSSRRPTFLRNVGFREFNTSSFYNGDLLELIIVPSAVSSGDLERLKGYAAHKWGTTASLPGGHPYKTNPPYV